MNTERSLLGKKETEPIPAYPTTLFCGYCKSGTTIITKTYAHCVDQIWNNEARKLWGISAMIDRSKPLSEFHQELSSNDRWTSSQDDIGSAPILKFPEGILVIDMFPSNTSVICVVRNPLDTVCAYQERQHEFESLRFTDDELIRRATDWNYHYLATSESKRPIKFVRYEDFVIRPLTVVQEISEFLDEPQVNPIPGWVDEQAQPYYKFVPEGQEIRGVGRYELSIKSQKIINSLLETCDPALKYLESQGISFDDVLKKI